MATTVADLHTQRADAYRAQGGKLMRDRRTGQYYATSGSSATTRYALSPEGCTCPGYRQHGHCKHHSALMVAIHKQTATCPDCGGRGYQIKAERLDKGLYRRVDVPCPRCGR